MRKPVRRLALLMMLLLVFIAPPKVSAANTASWFNFHVFAPCEIRIDFIYTKNLTISDVQSIGPSIYDITQNPQSVTFTAGDIDEYSFTVTLEYTYVVEQNIKISIKGGNYIPDLVQFPLKGQRFDLHFTVQTSIQPTFPTVEEITYNIVSQMSTRLDFIRLDIVSQIDVLEGGLNWMSTTTLVMSIVLIVLVVVLIQLLTRRSKQDKLDYSNRGYEEKRGRYG